LIAIEKSKPITSKIILKKSKVGNKEKVETETLEVEINLR